MTTDQYISIHSKSEDPILKELNRETHLKVPQPRMLSGHIQGIVLEFLSKMIKPENILEIGTYTGYSAICLAKGLKKSGKLYTIEINDERENIINKYFKKSGFEENIELHFGDALKIIPQLNVNFDMVFIDADKPNYLNYYKLIINKVKKGGYIIVDNVLWSGKVINLPDEIDEYTQGIIDFTNYVKKDENVEILILAIRDGLMIIQKK